MAVAYPKGGYGGYHAPARPRIEVVGRSIPPLVGALTQTVPEANRAKMVPGQKVKAELVIKNAGTAPGNFQVHGTIWRASTSAQVDKFVDSSGQEWPTFTNVAAGQQITVTMYSSAPWPSGYSDGEAFTASWTITAKDPATGVTVDTLELFDQQAIINLAIAKVQYVSSKYTPV